MAPRPKIKDYEQFQLRLPPGMRDRIKAKAERAGMSMNEAIVWCLEQHFPEPKSLEQRIEDLVDMVAILKSDDPAAGVDRLVAEIHGTLVDVYDRRLKSAHPDFAKSVAHRFLQWQEETDENWRAQHEDPFDDANWPDDPGFPDAQS